MSSKNYHRITTLFLSVLFGFLFSCATNSGVLTQVSSQDEQNQTPAGESADSPAYLTLKQVLEKAGYQGVGLKYESAQTLTLLAKVFSDPRTENRLIQLVYTGAAMLYDSQYKSLTVGGLKDPNAIVSYILKNVPAKPVTPPSANKP